MTKKLIDHQKITKEQTKKKMGYLFDDDFSSTERRPPILQKTQNVSQRNNSLFD